jgi:Transposase, Mutator family
VQTGVGPVGLAVPRDRAGTFEPLLIPKRSGRVAGGLDDMIISLYAHGMSVRDILHHLEQVYGTQLSHETAFAASPSGEEVPPGRPGLGRRLGRLHPVPGLQPRRPQAALHHTPPTPSSR